MQRSKSLPSNFLCTLRRVNNDHFTEDNIIIISGLHTKQGAHRDFPSAAWVPSPLRTIIGIYISCTCTCMQSFQNQSIPYTIMHVVCDVTYMLSDRFASPPPQKIMQPCYVWSCWLWSWPIPLLFISAICMCVYTQYPCRFVTTTHNKLITSAILFRSVS